MTDRRYCNTCERYVSGGVGHRRGCPEKPVDGTNENAADVLADLTGRPRSVFEYEGEIPELSLLETVKK